MPSAYTPLPISVNSVKSYFASALDALESVAEIAYPDAVSIEEAVTSLLTDTVRAAQGELERTSECPFFVTRYCTREVASQDTLVMGTDFDEYVQPMTYNRDNWLRRSGRTVLPKFPLSSITSFKLSLEQNAQVDSIDTSWLQRNDEAGVVNVIPSGLATAGLNFQSLMGVAVFARGAATGTVSMLVHVRFAAGLVERTGTYAAPTGGAPYDPAALNKNTLWNQARVAEYQTKIKEFATAILMRPVGITLANAGASISLDGMSEQVNGDYLVNQAKTIKEETLAWAQGLRQTQKGPRMVVI